MIATARVAIAAMLAGFIPSAKAQFVPPAGFSSNDAQLAVAIPTDLNAPVLSRIPDATLAKLFRPNPNYKRGVATAHVKVVGAYEIAESDKRRLNAAWSPGYLPVTLSFSDGHCYSFEANYNGGTLSYARLNETQCAGRPSDEEPPSSPPPGNHLKYVGAAWGYAAWRDDPAHTTIVTAPYAKTWQPLFRAEMATMGIMAMNGPDYPGGNVTLVGKINGRLTLVTLEVGF